MHLDSPLKSADYSLLQQCMHCGLCLPACPTYVATKNERNSPRGRLAWMRAIADGRMEAGRAFGEEMYFCLGCLACTSACPAGVDYAGLFERARAEVEENGVLSRPSRGMMRTATLQWLFAEPERLDVVGRAMRFWQDSGLQSAFRKTAARALPSRLRGLEAQSPTLAPVFSDDLVPAFTPASGARRWRVAMLSGCVQGLIFPGVNRDTADVLAHNGCEVHAPHGQPCCGSLHAHNGETAAARDLARRLIDLLPPGNFDAIISNAGGCGSHLRRYGELLEHDPRYAARAKVWDTKLRDVHEWLAEIGIQAPKADQPERVVTYHESCHLAHGQKVRRQPREVLRSIPRLTLVELPESDWCCGSAGIYNITQPEMAADLLARKMRHIAGSGAEIVATGNPGCLLQLINGARARGLNLRVAHPVSLLAEAYRGEPA
jgi:glycolate oxidase iron-sulfur subunit